MRRRLSGKSGRDSYRSLIIAMVAMRIVEMPVDQVIDMLSMRDCFMAAVRAMHVLPSVSLAPVGRRAAFRIVPRDGEYVLIDMVIMRVMQVSVMQVTNVIIVHDARMAALRAVRMGMIFMLRQVTIAHRRSLHKKMNN